MTRAFWITFPVLVLALLLGIVPSASATATRARSTTARTPARAAAVIDTGRLPVITVNGESLSRDKYDVAVDQDVRQALARSPFGSNIDPRDPEFASLRTRFEAHTRERLTNWLVLLTAARRARVRVPNDSVTQIWQQATAAFDNDTALQEALRESGKTRADVMDDIRNNLTIDLFVKKRIGTIVVPDSEARAFFEENRERYAQPEVVRARHILIRDTDALARIRDVRSRIVGGADFAEMARQFSQDGSASNGGDLGMFDRGRMVPTFESAAFALPVGHVSEPVQTQFGWHLIKVEEHRAAAAADFETNREDVLRRCRDKKRAEKLQALIEDLKRRATIRVNLPALPPAETEPAR